MSSGAIFLYGAVGGFAGMLAIQVLPILIGLKKKNASLRIEPAPCIAIVGFCIVFAIFGGFAALGVSGATETAMAKTPIQAITYGLSWQGVFGGIVIGSLKL
jgi:hypothetical protein